MKIVSAKYLTSVVSEKDILNDDLKEFAFVGRSNVGKSSLINALTGVKNLAKTSSTPGLTKMINYFLINNSFKFVDLPGYGYHKASKGIANTWDKIMNDYFTDNEKLKLVLLLLDSRVLTTELDKQMMDYLFDKQIPALIVLTKVDKISRSELNLQIDKLSKELRYSKDRIVATSALKKSGVEKIGANLDEYIK